MNTTVLLIDDEEFYRRMVAMGFRRAGYTVHEADNGEQGLAMAKEHHPDLILLDLMMPGMLGFEVCKALREDSQFNKTAIIIMSAKSYKPDVDKSMELGADAYVVKPMDLESLLDLSEKHLTKRRNSP
ncbi:MAG: response regulator [bacterium]